MPILLMIMGGKTSAVNQHLNDRTALLLESAPFVVGVLLWLPVLAALLPVGSAGDAMMNAVILIHLSLGVATGGFFFLLFFISGIGWIITRHAIIGFVIMAVRGYFCVGALGIFLGDSMLGGVIFLIVSMAMAVCSALGLAYVRSLERTRDVPA